MVDPRAIAIVIRRKADRVPEDRTTEITEFEASPQQVRIRFRGTRDYPFGWDRVTVLQGPRPLPLGPQRQVLVDGSPTAATEAFLFHGPPDAGSWIHLLNPRGTWHSYPAHQVDIVPNVAASPGPRQILAYWRAVAERLDGDRGVLLRNHQKLSFVHPDSALARVLARTPIESRPEQEVAPAVYPFRTNLSQTVAVRNALTSPISVIDGPPGTGKTQTILNIIASVISRPGTTIGVVSFSNAAVDNVVTKLTGAGFGMVAANLGRTAKRTEFFETQPTRDAAVAELLRTTAPLTTDAASALAAVNRRLETLREQDRRRAEIRQEIHAYRLEQGHFQAFFEHHTLPDAVDLPLLRRYSAAKLLDFIADTDPRWVRDSGFARMVDTMNRYFRYRALRHVDAEDVDIVLGIQQRYYAKKISELEQREEQLSKTLAGNRFEPLQAEQARLSEQLFAEALRERYATRPRIRYDVRYRERFEQFTADYPLILSTCHSLQNSIGPGALLDYLIIDEASQVDPVTVAPALACARTVVVVGDLEQLPPVTKELTDTPPPPAPVFDYTNSILAMILELFPEAPRQMLREHYRCDPDIIEFCNRKFYDRALIPYTSGTPGVAPMRVVRTNSGNHMRRPFRDDDPETKGRSNQREIDVIRHEVIPWVAADFAPHEVGVTTPYRRQADKVTDALIAAIESDTVHKYQGREKEVMIMTTVLDDTPSSVRALRFADDPKLINVAVSRAMRLFVLVTHRSGLPASRHLRDLIGYITYRDPNHAVIDSEVVSIFDLLYTDAAERRRTHRRIGWGRTAVPSEDIALTFLNDLLAEDRYRHLAVHTQVLLQNVFPRTLTPLDPDQRLFVERRSSFDFVLFNRITNQNVCAIEVDGFYTHEADPAQRRRDSLKDEICRRYTFPLLRLPTTGSGEHALVRRFLDGLP